MRSTLNTRDTDIVALAGRSSESQFQSRERPWVDSRNDRPKVLRSSGAAGSVPGLWRHVEVWRVAALAGRESCIAEVTSARPDRAPSVQA